VKRALRIPAYRRLLLAYTMNDLTWAVGILALSVLVYRRTGSAIGTSAFFLSSQFVPALIAPPFVGKVDQLSVRAVLPLLYGVEALLFLGLAYATDHFELASVLIVVIVDGTIAVIARSITRAATVAVLTPAGLLREGNALINSQFSIAYMAGPAIGGLVVVSGGTVAAMLVNAALFALVALDLATTSGLPGAVPEKAPTAGRLRAAIAFVRRDRLITALLGTQAAAIVAFTIAVPVEVVFVQHTLHAGAGGYGAVLSAWGAGAVVASVAYVRWLSASARVQLAISAAALAIGFGLMAASQTIVMAVVAAAIAGSGNGVQLVAARTFVQERTELSWMAMVMGLQESIVEAAPGLGILIGGSVAALASPRAALGVAGAASLLITVMFWVVLRPSAASAADTAVDAEADTAVAADPIEPFATPVTLSGLHRPTATSDIDARPTARESESRS
jgi:predicted MFS family arabinose efflux permease